MVAQNPANAHAVPTSDSLANLPTQFTSWRSIDIAVSYYIATAAGEPVTKKTLGGRSSAGHVNAMLRALGMVSRTGVPRLGFDALAQGNSQHVLAGLEIHLPRLLDLLRRGQPEDEVADHLRQIGADGRVLRFVLDTLERTGSDVAHYRAIRLPQRTKTARLVAPLEGAQGGKALAEASVRQRLIGLHKGLIESVQWHDLPAVRQYNEMIDEIERNLQGM